MSTLKTPTRGPLSAANQDRIRAMAGDGVSIQEISAAVGRSVDVVTKVLVGGEGAIDKKPRRAAKTKGVTKKARRAAVTKGAAKTKKPKTRTMTNGRVANQGRAAMPSRAKKSVKSNSVGNAVMSGGKSGLLEHRYWLRSGLAVNLYLPGDLRTEEAERLAELVRNIPFSR